MQKFTVFLAMSLLFVLPAQADIMAMKPEIKLGIGARPAVMFAMIHNKGAATRLVSAQSPDFERIELHTHQTDPNGTMRMVQVDDFQVPANAILALTSGGHHLMLFGFRGKKGEDVKIELNFANGETLTVRTRPSLRAKAVHDSMHHRPH